MATKCNQQNQHVVAAINEVETGDPNKKTNTQKNENCDLNYEFAAGDHVYVWCHAGIYQHHGIIVQVCADNRLVIADFTNLGRQQGKEKTQQNNRRGSFISSSHSHQRSTSSGGIKGGFRFLVEDRSNWKKVIYNAPSWLVATRRPGTYSTSKPDPVQVILERVHFLMSHDYLVPPYHVMKSNCETVAVWCMTGKWQTLQISHLLNATKGASVLGTSGLYWGATSSATLATLIGTTTEVIVASPYLIPAVATAGIISGGMSVWNALSVRRFWRRISDLLLEEFDRFMEETATIAEVIAVQDFNEEDTKEFLESSEGLQS